MKRINKGFTLIELMAVVVIISLIAILTFPNWKQRFWKEMEKSAFFRKCLTAH